MRKEGIEDVHLATGLMAKMEEVRSAYCKLQVWNVAVAITPTIRFRERGVATKLVSDISNQLTMPLVREIALENYALDFVAKTYGKAVPDKEKVAVDARGIPLDNGIVKKAEGCFRFGEFRRFGVFICIFVTGAHLAFVSFNSDCRKSLTSRGNDGNFVT